MAKILHQTQFGRLAKLHIRLCSLLLFTGCLPLSAQQKYWYFIEQSVSKDSAEALLSSNGLKPVHWSEWFHAWSARGAKKFIPFADSSQFVSPVRVHSLPGSARLGFALEQIHAEAFAGAGFTGKGVRIGIIDGGFWGADRSAALRSILESGRLTAFRNFLPETNQNPFSGTHSLDDQHGTEVWELAGGFDAQKNILFGLATGADYYLARTDHGAREERQEEDFLIAALEWLHSQQVKLVNVSLGYNTDFDNPGENYTRDMMDGKTTLVSLACQRASEKGMLVVVASGNDGRDVWEIISAPADAPGVLTVGSTDAKYWRKTDFSSVGPGFTSFLKPEISCFSSSGTSFSAPVITGLAACIWEQDSSLSGSKVKELILQSGHLAAAPNNYLGYGVPDCMWLVENVPRAGQPAPPATASPVKKRKVARIVLPQSGPNHLVLFHKKDGQQILEQRFFTTEGNQLQVKPIPGAMYTTVVVNHEFLMEIEWVR